MRLVEFTEEPLLEARMVWKRSGNKVKRGVRCTSGRRKGRVVSTASQCSSPVDLKKRLVLKRTKSKLGKRLGRKAQRTRRLNPASRRLKILNR
jgi:hypothetical protein